MSRSGIDLTLRATPVAMHKATIILRADEMCSELMIPTEALKPTLTPQNIR